MPCRGVLRLAVVSAAIGVSETIELGEDCEVQSVVVIADKGGVATFIMQGIAALVDPALTPTRSFTGLSGCWPAMARITGGSVNILYLDTGTRKR